MAEFSADRSPKAMPARFSPRAGNLGAQAAQQKGAQGRRPGPDRSASAGQGQQQVVGRPQPVEEQEQDLSHLPLALQHFNMKGLGRDVPYIVWANLTGNYRQYAEPGRVPWDALED